MLTVSKRLVRLQGQNYKYYDCDVDNTDINANIKADQHNVLDTRPVLGMLRRDHDVIHGQYDAATPDYHATPEPFHLYSPAASSPNERAAQIVEMC
jgi:hypothetical protein